MRLPAAGPGLVSGSQQFSCGPSPLPFIRGNPCCSPVTRLALAQITLGTIWCPALIECDWNSSWMGPVLSRSDNIVWIFHVGGWGSLRCWCVLSVLVWPPGPGGSFSWHPVLRDRGRWHWWPRLATLSHSPSGAGARALLARPGQHFSPKSLMFYEPRVDSESFFPLPLAHSCLSRHMRQGVRQKASSWV